MQRREFLTVLTGAVAAAMLPINALAELLNQTWNKAWNKTAFEATKLDEATKGLNISTETPSKDIEPSKNIDIVAPDRAEQGAVVQFSTPSNTQNNERFTLLAARNPNPST